MKTPKMFVFHKKNVKIFDRCSLMQFHQLSVPDLYLDWCLEQFKYVAFNDNFRLSCFGLEIHFAGKFGPKSDNLSKNQEIEIVLFEKCQM